MSENIVFGRHSVKEALGARNVDSILLVAGARSGGISEVISAAKMGNIPIKNVAREKLDKLCEGANHQGVAAILMEGSYSSFEEVLVRSQENDRPPFVVVANGIEDPQNLGAIIRTAECAGAHGLIIPKRRSAGLTMGVNRASSGALSHLKVARVANISDTLKRLKAEGFWVFGADMNGEPFHKVDFTGPVALVLGGEGAGLGPLVRENCDVVVSLPMFGRVQSLNVSVAGGVLMYEVVRQRMAL